MTTFREWEVASVALVANHLQTWTLVEDLVEWEAPSIAHVLVVPVPVFCHVNNRVNQQLQLSRMHRLTILIDCKSELKV